MSRKFEVLHGVLDALGIPRTRIPGSESEDVMGTLARLAAERGLDAVIVTRDKDCKQLLSPHVTLYDNRKDIYIDVDSFKEETGLTPGQVIEMMALAGDSSDNIPGVPGFGPKTATTLIKEYGDLESVIEHADDLTKSKRQKLLDNAEQARLSRRLVTIKTDVPLEVELDELKPRPPDADRTRELFLKLGFNKYLDQLNTIVGNPADTVETTETEYCLVTDEDELNRLARELAKAKRLAVDTETTGLEPMRAELVGISLSDRVGRGWYVPVKGPELSTPLPAERVIDLLKPILEDPSIEKVGHNIKFDRLVLGRAGIDLQGVGIDTMVASYLLEPGQRRHNLDDVAERRLGYSMVPIDKLIGKGAKQTTIDTVDLETVSNYACEDAEVSLRLAECLVPQLEQKDLGPLFRDLEMPLVEVLGEMERVGITVDCTLLGQMSQAMAHELEELTGEIYDLAEGEFNIDSPKQLSVVLFEKLELPTVKKTKTGFSTDQEVLEVLAARHPLPRLILKHRQLTKLKSTYVDVLPRMVNPDTGRVHTSFNQTVTATGRLSSSDPNLQNIPVRNELGGQIRKAFVPRDGWKLISADYSQVELRILAHLSGDEALKRDFKEEKDIHTETAARIFDVDPRLVDSMMRSEAKAINFGIIYGQSPYGLGRQLGISQARAKKIIDAYYDKHPGVERFFTELLVEAQSRGFVTTMTGRRRYVEGIKNPESRNRNQAERVAVNTVIQGSAADLIKLAMLRLHRLKLEGTLPGDMLLQIHDELLHEVPAERAGEASALIEREMIGAMNLDVPLSVHVGTGDNWLDVK